MIFKRCTCGVDVGPHNVERIVITPMGLWWHHPPKGCETGGFMPLREVKARAELHSNGDIRRQLEIDFYKDKLNELERT